MAHYDEQEDALLEKERQIREKRNDVELDFEVPEVDIQYQEDDGNSNCDGGGCTI